MSDWSECSGQWTTNHEVAAMLHGVSIEYRRTHHINLTTVTRCREVTSSVWEEVSLNP